MSDSCKPSYRHAVVRAPVYSVRRLTHAEFRKSQKLAFRDDKRQITAQYGSRRKRGTVVSTQDW